MDEILEITIHVARTLDRLGVPYLIGGSLASSLHGIPRSTQDVDIVAELTQSHVAGLVGALHDSFYLDEGAIREAVEQRLSFNLIHLRTLLKVDVFVAKDDEAARAQMRRRLRYEISPEDGEALTLASAEDVVAHKLYWYSLGDEVSERQWSDAIGVLRVQGPRLNQEILRRAATLLGVDALLRRALAEVALIDNSSRDDG